jgi:hypothetical protein
MYFLIGIKLLSSASKKIEKFLALVTPDVTDIFSILIGSYIGTCDRDKDTWLSENSL